MIYFVYVKNPLQVKDTKDERVLEYIPQNTLGNYIRSVALFDMETISVSVNGQEETDMERILNDRDFVVVCPKVEKSVLAIVAMVALSFVSMGVGNLAMGAAWGATNVAWNLGAYLAAAAVMYVGGLIVNSLLGTNVNTEEFEQSSTYGWDTGANDARQGGAVPITYGTVRITGQCIAQHIYSSSTEDKQYLNMLLCGGEGEVDSITDVEIDETPLEYYNDVSLETRLGTNDQTCMTYFNETYSDQPLGFELKETWNTAQVAGNGASALEMLIQCPNGLYYSNDSGGLSKTTVKVEAQFREVGATEWESMIGNGLVQLAPKLANRVAPSASKAVVGGKTNIDSTYSSEVNTFLEMLGYAVRKVTGYEILSAYDWDTTDGKCNFKITGIEFFRECSFGEVFTIKVEEVSTILVHAHNPRWAVSIFNPDVYKTIPTKLGVYSSVQGLLGYVAPGTKWSGEGISFLATAMDYPSESYYDEDSGEYVSTPRGQSHVGDTYTIKVSTRTQELEITEATQDAVRRTLRVSGLDETKFYEMRAYCSYKTDTTSRYVNKVYWTMLSQVFDEKYTYPNNALVGVRALATDQLSGNRPEITWIQTRLNIYVFNPYTGQYEVKRADNPAWACYDVLHRCRKLKNIHTGVYEYEVNGSATSSFLYDEFSAWADFCEDEGLYVNIHFDVSDDIWTQLGMIEEMGRGKVIRRGTRYGCIYDAPSEMVQLFTVSNIFQDSFSEEFLALTERANAVEVTFINKDKNYTQDVVTLYDSSYDATDKLVNPTQRTFYGCTDISRAIREGKYMMRMTNNLIRTVGIEVDVDAIACQVGDVVGIQHDVPQWGTGGRVISYQDVVRNEVTVKELVLDKEVSLEAGKNYTIMCRLIDEENVREVFDYKTFSADATETTNTLYLADAFAIAPEAETLFTFGETGKSVKKVRVLDISRSQDLKRVIHGLEYIPEVYNEDEPIPPQVTYAPKATRDAVTDLIAVPNFFISKLGVITPEVKVNWNIPKTATPDYFVISLIGDNGNNYTQRVYGAKSCTFSNISMDIYDVKVSAIYSGASKDAFVMEVDISEKTTPPNNVLNLGLVQDATYPHVLHITWDVVGNYDLAGYEIREGVDWDTATLVAFVTANSYDYVVMESGTKNILVKAKDTSGNYSIDATTCSIIMVDVELDDITGFAVEQLL